MSEVVKEGFTEKVGFEHHLVSTESQKGGRRGESVAAKTEQTGRTGGNTNDVQETGIILFGAFAGLREDGEARLGPGWEATTARTCFSNCGPWNTGVPLSWRCEYFMVSP